MRRNHSIIACSRHIYMVLFFTHIAFLVNRAEHRAFQRNAGGVVATTEKIELVSNFFLSLYTLHIILHHLRCEK